MNPIIKTQLELIKKEAIIDEENDFFREVAIWLKDSEESVNFIVDKYFTFEIDEHWLFLRYNNGDIGKEPLFYTYTFALAEIRYITDEV